MNRSDVRALGIGSVAAIVVSLVTVIVYEGHVKATSNCPSVTVQPSVQVGTPPGDPQDTARIHDLEKEIAGLKVLIEAHKNLEELRDMKARKDKKAPNDAKEPTAPKEPDPTTSTGACDADALHEKGDDYLRNRMDVAALAQFEASLRCKYDVKMVKIAFLAACRAKQTVKAKEYFSQMPPTGSTLDSYSRICLRLGIDVYDRPATSEKASGVIRVSSTPAANIQLDGKLIGGGLQVSMQATPGKHDVTFVIESNKYTYAVVVKAGETTTLVKDFSHE